MSVILRWHQAPPVVKKAVIRTPAVNQGETPPGLLAVAGICFTLALLIGCGSSPSKLYRAFPEQKRQFGNIAIMMDYIMIEGLMEDTSKVDLIENRRVGSALLTVCADTLIRKGYPIRKSVFSSIGLLMQSDRAYRVVRTSQAEHADAEQLPIGAPPFYVDDQFSPDSVLGLLMSFYYSLINIPQKREGATVTIPEAVSIGRQVDCSTIMVLLVGGFNVPVAKGVGQPTASQSKTMGIVTVQGVSQLSMMLYIIDAKSGEIIWDDSKHLSGGVVFPAKILDAASDLLDELP